MPDYHTHFCPSWKDFLQKFLQKFLIFSILHKEMQSFRHIRQFWRTEFAEIVRGWNTDVKTAVPLFLRRGRGGPPRESAILAGRFSAPLGRRGMRRFAKGIRHPGGMGLPPRKRRGICRPPFSLKKKMRRGRWKRNVFYLGKGLVDPWSR